MGGSTSSFGTGLAELVPACPPPTYSNDGVFTGRVTSVGTGVLGALELVPTVGMVVPSSVGFIASGRKQEWVLTVSTAPTDATHQRPNDFNAISNARVWVQAVGGPVDLSVLPASTATLFVDAASQNGDALATRGNTLPFQTLNAAINVAQSGDTIQVATRSGVQAVALTGQLAINKNLNFVGNGRGRSVVSVDNGTSLSFAVGTRVHFVGVDFVGPAQATANSGVLINLNQTLSAEVVDCGFSNFNQCAVSGVATTRTVVRDNRFSRVGLGFYCDDTAGAYNADLVLDGNICEWTFAGSYICHSPNSYNAMGGEATPYNLPYSNSIRLTNNIARYAFMGAQDSGNKLAIEVWHGWTGGVISGNVAEDSYFGFSFDRLSNMAILANRSQNCSFSYEFNTCNNLSIVGNIADARPLPTSPFVSGGNHGSVLFDGGCRDCHWIGGVVTGMLVNFQNAGVTRCSITKARLAGSTVFLQHPAGEIDVNDNFIAAQIGLPAVGSWLIVDLSGTAMGRISFKRNTIIDGAAGFGIDFINIGTTGTISLLELEDNSAPSAVAASGQFNSAAAATCVTSHVYKRNLGVTGNNPLPSTDDLVFAGNIMVNGAMVLNPFGSVPTRPDGTPYPNGVGIVWTSGVDGKLHYRNTGGGDVVIGG